MTLATSTPRRLLTGLLIGVFVAAGAAPGDAKPSKTTIKAKAKAKGKREMRITKDRRTKQHLPAGAFFGRPISVGLFGFAPGSGAETAPGQTQTGPGTGAGAPAPGTAPSEPPTTDGTQALGVRETEDPAYVTTLSRPSVRAGSVLVQLQNVGADPHNLRIIRSDGSGPATQFADVAPNATSTKAVNFTQGTYRLFCTLTAPESHDAAGMNATLTVTAQR